MPKDTKTLGNNKARACESLGFAHKKGCANILTQPLFIYIHKEKQISIKKNQGKAILVRTNFSLI